MNIPFKIFPSIGYKNSQFQIVSSWDNLIVEICTQNEIVKTVKANSNYPTILTDLNTSGKFIAKCKFDNTEFQQEFEIMEAYRLGASEFKKAFLFDDTNYSFFLMKDRLLLYDEEKKIMLIENHYSPTEIHKINKTKYLFVTKVGNSVSGIVNLGIYCTESFSLVAELKNNYREIKIIPDTNKAWLFNIKSKTIHCFELANQNNKYFTEIKLFEKINDFFLDIAKENIYIDHNESLIFSNLNNLQNSFNIIKKQNNAIDKLGNVFTIDNSTLCCNNLLTKNYLKLKLNFDLNLHDEDFIHLGSDLKSKFSLTDPNKIADEIRNELLTSFSEAKTYHYHAFPENKIISETYTSHNIYPTYGGVFIIEKKKIRIIKGVTFRKYQNNWAVTPYTIELNEFTLLFLNSLKVVTLVDKSPNLTVIEYENSMLLINYQNSKLLFCGNNKFTTDIEDSIDLFTIDRLSYFLVKYKEYYSLFLANNFDRALLDQIEILNLEQFKEQKTLWYRGNKKHLLNVKYLNAFDLKNGLTIFIDEKKIHHSFFKDAFDIKFFEKYALSSNQVVFNPINFDVKDAYVGLIESHSKMLNKIVSLRSNLISLSIFNFQTRKYELEEIPIDDWKFKESYLSPDGRFLVLQEDSNKYSFYDIEKNENIMFFSGVFLAFRKDGSLIVEQDNNKAVKIIDPKTFLDITPPNYHHYRFMSPDGKLYAHISSKERYFDKLNGQELNFEDVKKIRQDLDTPNTFFIEIGTKEKELELEKNRKEIYEKSKRKFEEIGINDYNKITSHAVIKVEKYLEIGISGTSITSEINLPEDLYFYNYSAFSYDNKYFGYVGKPSSNGLINLFKIDFDEVNSKLQICDTYLSRYPRYASWVCGFSKTGYFATYDSTPDTYIIIVDDMLFEGKTTDIELRQNIYNSKTNIYHTFNMWNEIKGKNFLCFSPSGDYLALSEQGYEPLTQGGYGHQESNVVHIAKTTNGQIIDSFRGHGDKIKDNFNKKVTFVSFSEDESRIMTLSSDGVVIVRDINLHDINMKRENSSHHN